jgi:hypothetical protein
MERHAKNFWQYGPVAMHCCWSSVAQPRESATVAVQVGLTTPVRATQVA